MCWLGGRGPRSHDAPRHQRVLPQSDPVRQELFVTEPPSRPRPLPAFPCGFQRWDDAVVLAPGQDGDRRVRLSTTVATGKMRAVSPDSATIQWLVVACTVFQTVVAATQTAARSRGESRPANRALDYPIKMGVLAAANGHALFLAAPRVRDLAADEQATTPMEVLGVIVVLVASCLPAYSVGAARVPSSWTESVSMNAGWPRPAIARWNASPALMTSDTRVSSAAPGSHCHASQPSTIHWPDEDLPGEGSGTRRCARGCPARRRRASWSRLGPRSGGGPRGLPATSVRGRRRVSPELCRRGRMRRGPGSTALLDGSHADSSWCPT